LSQLGPAQEPQSPPGWPRPTPSRRRILQAGQNPVKADWMRFTPTKAASQS